jgi:hypothetical protein
VTCGDKALYLGEVDAARVKFCPFCGESLEDGQ